MKRLIRGATNSERIEAAETIEIDLKNYDIENDPDGIFDIENEDDDTLYSFNSYDEYRQFIKIFDERD